MRGKIRHLAEEIENMMLFNKAKKRLDKLEAMYEWSLLFNVMTDEEMAKEAYSDFVHWHVPLPMPHLEKSGTQPSLECFCVNRIIYALKQLATNFPSSYKNGQFCRVYAIIYQPDLFGSEIGAVFTEEKWDSLVNRDIRLENYIETRVADFNSSILTDKYACLVPIDISQATVSEYRDNKDGNEPWRGTSIMLFKDI